MPDEDEKSTWRSLSPSATVSLRDWFAGQADISQIQFPNVQSAADFLGEPKPDEDNFVQMIGFSARLWSKLAYMRADAMLAERAK